MQIDQSVFISYRRDVSAFMARAILQDLRGHGFDVFMDVESIDSGEFDEIILNQIAARTYFLVILTPGTLERCVEPDDWLRREIEQAIDVKRVIIPLITPNFSFEAAQPFLTGKLEELPGFNAVSIPHEYFEAAMEKLRTRFLKPVMIDKRETSEMERIAVRQKLDHIIAQPAVTADQLDAQDHLERGLAHFRQGQYSAAVAEFDRAVQLNARYVEAYYNRGEACYQQGDLEGAVTDFQQALQLKPGHPQSRRMQDVIASQRQSRVQAQPRHTEPVIAGPVPIAPSAARASHPEVKTSLPATPQLFPVRRPKIVLVAGVVIASAVLFMTLLLVLLPRSEPVAPELLQLCQHSVPDDQQSALPEGAKLAFVDVNRQTLFDYFQNADELPAEHRSARSPDGLVCLDETLQSYDSQTYDSNFICTRQKRYVAATIVDVKSGKAIGSQTFYAVPPECPAASDKDVNIVGDLPPASEVVNWALSTISGAG
jgi:tetratricopeptide (TPR) repeat protein